MCRICNYSTAHLRLGDDHLWQTKMYIFITNTWSFHTWIFPFPPYNVINIHSFGIIHIAVPIVAKLRFSDVRYRRFDIDWWHASVLSIIRLFVFHVIYERTTPWITNAFGMPGIQDGICFSIYDGLRNYSLIAHLLTRHISRVFLYDTFLRHLLLLWRFQTGMVLGDISRSILVVVFLLLLSFLAVILLQTTNFDHRRYIWISIGGYL